MNSVHKIAFHETNNIYDFVVRSFSKMQPRVTKTIIYGGHLDLEIHCQFKKRGDISNKRHDIQRKETVITM